MIKEYFKEKVGNMRDLGGWEIKGKNVGFINILRSNVPLNLEESDIKYLKNLGISNIVDLRTKKEYETKVSCFENRTDFNVYHIPLPGGSTIPESVEAVPKSYINMIGAKQEMNNIFKLLLKGEGILYFCNAGKDRTGAISMLLLMIFGATEEIICMDYLKTNDYLAKIIKVNNFSQDIINIITPKVEYAKTFCKLFKEKYNSIEYYLECIGIKCEELNRIRTNYLK